MKNKFISLSFISIIVGFFLLNTILPDKEISFSERRKLKLFPSITLDNLFAGKTIDDFESYTLDQFAFRDSFRSLKASIELNIFNKLDNNNIFVSDDNIFKIDYPLKEKEVLKFTSKLNNITSKYFKNNNVYLGIVPEKNYYLEDNKHLKIDYDYLISLVNSNIKNIEYIDLTKSLTLEDYYYTDLHWRQESLDKVVTTLSEKMNFQITDKDYIVESYSPFYGAYYGQSALNVKPDTINYLTNNIIENAIVTNLEDKTSNSVYNKNKLGTLDSYDVFLSGATPFLEIVNPLYEGTKELIIFRDSFGSSLAPLLIEGYSKITLIDLRYVNLATVEQLIEFNTQDVLFLYSTLVINSSSILRD